jgi:hypothetical protein
MLAMPVTLAAVWTAAKGLAEAVGQISGIAKKLQAAPDAAAVELVRILDEIGKTHHAVDAAVARYLAIVDDPSAFAQGAKSLLELEGGVLAADVEAGRGHCHDIYPIYVQHLQRWFERALDPTEQLLMKGTFEALGQADGTLFGGLASVADVLDRGASDAIDLYRSKDAAAARARIDRDFDELRKLRASLSNTAKSLRTMRIEFGDLLRSPAS